MKRAFAAMQLLHLSGRPAAEDMGAVSDAWIRVILASGVTESDRDGVIKAFELLMQECEKWPAPAALIKRIERKERKVVMVPRIEHKKPVITEVGKKILSEIKKTLENAPCFDRTWINGTKSRSVDECIAIHNAQKKAANK